MFVRIGLGRHNADEVATIYRTLRAIGVDVVQVKPWIPSGLAATDQAELSLSPSKLFDTFTNAMEALYEELEDAGGPELTVSCTRRPATSASPSRTARTSPRSTPSPAGTR